MKSGARRCRPSWCHAPASSPRESDLLDWCRERIAGYKRPRSVLFVSEREMPRTATGKIQHRVLRDRIVTRN